MASDELTSNSPISGPALPPLRIHHILAATVTTAVLLSLHELLRERDALGFATFFRSGHGIIFTIVTALSCTLTIFGIWWRHQGLPYFDQPGHWLLVGNSLSIGTFLFAALAAALQWENVPGYSLLITWFIGMSLLGAAINFWAAFRAADTFWWRSLFVVTGGMSLLLVLLQMISFYSIYQFVYWLGGIAIMFLLLASVISDRRVRRLRDWPHWLGAGLDLVLSTVAIGQLCWQWFTTSS